jgi:hypothetical protein
MAAKPRKQRIAYRFDERYHLGGRGKPPIVSLHRTMNSTGEILNYGLAFIDFTVFSGDNGRVLGYDNGHGVHERHFMGKSSLVDFVSYEDTADRFFAEVDRLRRGK